MFEYTVTIGRNVGDAPMGDVPWKLFKRDAMVILGQAANHAYVHVDAYETLEGSGVWQGIREDNARIVMRTDSQLDDGALNYLRHLLGMLAQYNSQDAVALTVGTSELVTRSN
jgi:hypothetical protein